MSLADELRDPWSYVAASFVGGMAAVTTNPWAGLGVGAVVFATKVVTGLFTRGAKPKRRMSQRERRLPVMTRTPEAAWFDRARRAQELFDDIAGSAHEGPIAERVQSFGAETEESLATLERLAGQASAIRSAMGRLDPRRLAWERDRILIDANRSQDPRVLAERERSLNAVQSQLDAYERLTGTLTMLLARLESGTLGIEGLVARLAEVIALAESSLSPVDGQSEIDELALELEGLRAGLTEAESVSARAMQGLTPLPAPGAGSVPTTEPPPARRRAGGE